MYECRKKGNNREDEKEIREILAVKNRKRIIILIVILIIIAGTLLLSAYLKKVYDYKQKVNKITVEDIDVSKLSDGIYFGEYDAVLVAAKVKVTVKNGKIKIIDIIEHKNEKGKAAEKIVDNIIKEQNIDADIAAGATNSSKVIKKAVEDALTE